MRKNGFSAPLHRLQILSWILVGICVVGFYCLFLPGLDSVELGICAGVYTIFLILTCYFTIRTTAYDSADPKVTCLQESNISK
jgi:hypothetical protein